MNFQRCIRLCPGFLDRLVLNADCAAPSFPSSVPSGTWVARVSTHASGKNRSKRQKRAGSGFLIIFFFFFTFLFSINIRIDISSRGRSSPLVLFSPGSNTVHHEALGQIDFEVLRSRATLSKIRIIVSRQHRAFRLIVADNRRDAPTITNGTRTALALERHANATVRIRTVSRTNARNTRSGLGLDASLLAFRFSRASYVDVDGDDATWSGW